jgi:clan AA aspartic protease (TIGR02281 family)
MAKCPFVLPRNPWLRLSAGIAIAIACGASCAAEAKCTLARIADWPVRMERGHLLVDGYINGQKVNIILDTGAGTTMMFRETAARLGLPVQEAKGVRIFGVGGESQVDVAFIEEIRLGDAVRTSWKVYVVGDKSIGADLLLSEEFFRNVDVEFDLAHNAVRLYQAKDCDGVPLAYWTTDAVESVDIEPMTIGQSLIELPVVINGRRIIAMLDSGAPNTIMEKGEAARVGVTPDTPGVIAAGKSRGIGRGSTETWVGTFQTFTIGNETFEDAEILFSDMFKDAKFMSVGSHIPTKVMSGISMLLGLDFLLGNRVMVAHSQRKLYFTPTGAPVFKIRRPPAQRTDTVPPVETEKASPH